MLEDLKDVIDFLCLLLVTVWIFLAVKFRLSSRWALGVAFVIFFPARILVLWAIRG